MLTSYIYAQSGYKMRLGRNEQNIYLLYASEHGIYDIAYFDIKKSLCHYIFLRASNLNTKQAN